ncbi:MAG: transglycosylase SLT domain-containing protein [Bacteroidales bacterium]|nr:transglycosylase SLT domain-containing protein [Bacteroidales bacterium]
MPHIKTAYLKAALTLIILVLAGCRDSRMRELRHSGHSQTWSEQTLRCTIIVGPTLRDSYQFGLAYELLSVFCETKECTLEICILDSLSQAIDSIRSGGLDIAVLTDAPDTLGGVIQSFSYDSSHTWVVNEDKADNLHEVNLWLAHTVNSSQEYIDLKKLFETSYSPFKRAGKGIKTKVISPYDRVIKKYAKEIGWDWRMVAALIYHESHFTINTVSKRGAQGLMQVMPMVGDSYGAHNLMDPDENIKVGTAVLRKLQHSYPTSKYSPEESMKFTLAAYNAGVGRIADCKKVARAKGLDDTIWENVRSVIPTMADEATLENVETKFGAFYGKEVLGYVNAILGTYQAFCSICP